MSLLRVQVSEALALGCAAGLNPKTLSMVLNTSSGRCWASDSYNPCPARRMSRGTVTHVCGRVWTCVDMHGYVCGHVWSPVLLTNPGPAIPRWRNPSPQVGTLRV
eukprot:362121-Chlamydomonas_euryale.AAC.2